MNILFIFLETLERLKPWVGLKLHYITKTKTKKIQAYPIILNTSMQYKKAID
jgi:hypothetical protein